MLAIFPRRSRRVLLGSLLAVIGGGLSSAQAQSAWTLANAPTNANWYSLAVPAGGGPLVAAVYGGGIYSSTNLGNSWQLTPAPVLNWFTVAASADGRVIAACVFNSSAPTGRIYVSTNSGAAWQLTSAPGQYWTSIAASAAGNKLVAVSSGNTAATSGIFTSTNYGATWQRTGAPVGFWNTVASAAAGDKLVAVEYSGGIHTSTNGGGDWQNTGIANNLWSGVTVSADGTKLAATVIGGGIYGSTNFGGAWSQTSAPDADWLTIASSSSGKVLLAGADGGGILTSTNSGATWQNTGAPTTDWYSVATSASGSKFLGVVFGGGIYYTQLPLAQAATVPGTPTVLTLTRGHLDGASFTFSLVSNPTNGTLSGLNASAGTVTYTPVTNYSGTDRFTFRVYDGSIYTTGTVTLTVAPANQPPVANDQHIVLLRNTATNLVLTATDPDSPSLTYATNTAPAHGTLSAFNPATGAVRYTPASNYFGEDSFTFTVSDGEFQAEGLVTLIVFVPPLATNQNVTMLEDGTTNLVLTASYLEAADPTYAILTPPAHGSLSPLDPDTGEVAYTPTANYRGADSFSFTAYDGALYATGTVSFTILAATNWHSVAMTPAGDLMAVVDFGGGIYTSTNYGGSWQKTSALDRNWVAVVISFAGENPGDFMAAAAQGDGIYTSTNRGVSWNKTSATNANWTAMVAGYDGRKNLWKLTAAARYDGIYTSTNSGTTWQKTTAPALDWTALAATFPGGTVGATAYGDGIYFSTDSGANWGLSLGSEVEGFNNWSCLALAANFNTVQLLAGGILGGRLYTALDFDAVLGESFTPDQDLAWRGLGSAELAEAGTFLVAATTGGVYTSADSGDNWAATAAPAADWRAVALAPDGSKYIAAAYGGAIYLYDPPIRLNLLPYSLRTDIVAAGLTFTWANNSAASGYGLQQTSSLNPATWTDVDAFALGGETYDDGNLRVTIIPRPATTAFYRLKR